MGARLSAFLWKGELLGRKLAGCPGLIRLLALATVAGFVLSSAGADGARAADNPNVTISATAPFTFAQKTINIDAGTTVKWTAAGTAPHTVTADGCADPSAGPCTFDSGLTTLLRGGSERSTYEFRFNNPGVYAYFCRIHGAQGGVGQAGTVIVGSGGAPAKTAAQLRPNVSVVVYSPTEGQTIAGDRVNVRLGVNGSALRAPVQGQTDRLFGHVNLILDQPNLDLAQIILAGPGVTRSNTREAVLEGVRPGAHTLTAVWTYDNNVAPQPPITWTVRFNTTAGPTAPPAAAPAITPPSTGDAGLLGDAPPPWPLLAFPALAAVAGVRLMRHVRGRI